MELCEFSVLCQTDKLKTNAIQNDNGNCLEITNIKQIQPIRP